MTASLIERIQSLKKNWSGRGTGSWADGYCKAVDTISAMVREHEAGRLARDEMLKGIGRIEAGDFDVMEDELDELAATKIDPNVKSFHLGTEALSDEDMAKLSSGEASPSSYGMGQVYPAKSSAEVVERVARSIARCHYARKQHYGVCTKDERLDHRVNQYWRQFTADAEAAIAAMGGASETGIGNHASTARQQDHALTPPARPGNFTAGNLKVSGGAPSELRDDTQSEAFNLAVDLGDKLFSMIRGTVESKYSWNRYEVSKAIEGVILEAMEPYLRTTEPVSVSRSLEKCAKALEDRGIVLVSRYSLNDVVKTVFDASEVQYVD